MDAIYEERRFKRLRILEEYDKRKTQHEIAVMFGMGDEHVSWVTQMNNYHHTRKITPENRKEGEYIRVVTFEDEYAFLDKYPIENFEK